MSEEAAVNKNGQLTKEKVFSEQFIKYHGDFGALYYTMNMGPWDMTLMLRSDFDHVPVGQIYAAIDEFLAAAYHLGAVSGFAEALNALYNMGLLKDYLDNPKTVAKLQRLVFEIYWLEQQLEKPGLSGTKHLSTRAAKLDSKLFKFMVRALEAAKAKRC
jgi:hypothetical protein